NSTAFLSELGFEPSTQRFRIRRLGSEDVFLLTYPDGLDHEGFHAEVLPATATAANSGTSGEATLDFAALNPRDDEQVLVTVQLANTQDPAGVYQGDTASVSFTYKAAEANRLQDALNQTKSTLSLRNDFSVTTVANSQHRYLVTVPDNRLAQFTATLGNSTVPGDADPRTFQTIDLATLNLLAPTAAGRPGEHFV
ncbi:MAG: hypothetical protein GY888_28285, partial [Planctomycetaceae bacterium]|nr:hypothetical protein [Planctomycetaceae bacterium]